MIDGSMLFVLPISFPADHASVAALVNGVAGGYAVGLTSAPRALFWLVGRSCHANSDARVHGRPLREVPPPAGVWHVGSSSAHETQGTYAIVSTGRQVHASTISNLVPTSSGRNLYMYLRCDPARGLLQRAIYLVHVLRESL